MREKETRRTVGLMLAASFMALMAAGQAHGQAVGWEDDRWRIAGQEHRVERHEGRESLYLANGIAWLDGIEFRDGTVSFDLHASSELGFHGVAFRAVDDANYEHFYLRPFVSGNPDASQYTPVFDGVSGWQIYTGPRFGLPVATATDDWVHVELQVKDGTAEVYVDGELLVFPELQRSLTAGRVGLTSGGAPARFANLRVEPDTPMLSGEAGAPPAEPPPGVLTRWRVSSPFPETSLDGSHSLDDVDLSDLGWEAASPHLRGIVDLARVRTLGDPDNTVFAAVTLEAGAARPVRVRFGFSDRVRVYLGGRELYRGRAEWRSRDYKFLGTVGLFDEIVVPLEAGENELWFAVSEGFGGWAVTAALVDAEGVRATAGGVR